MIRRSFMIPDGRREARGGAARGCTNPAGKAG